ncbi:methyl-accepting chemotaxis protein [Psychromonas algicola]|uniref:methyl-accepting chemotaxis protein n=1 Tax=Psychromonas algicola TaxID=2555642 RepID=UPI001068577A|nr:methyl-accepting chemotaxis protein [Psychromonas sp. RZ5]TEW52905.1 methyl-accepting chemotaxis protein [Psychromonas sp. RZ5]
MEILESLLHSFNTSFVNSVILILMVIVFAFGLWFTKKDEQPDFVHYVPTLLTTMGIFGTFLGIVLGLLDFDQSNIESSIPPLLAGLKTAFITSLLGIFSSLIFKTLSTFSFLKPLQDENTIVYATPEAILQSMNEQVAEIKSLKSAMVGDEQSTLFSELKSLREDVNSNAQLLLENDKKQAEQQEVLFTQFSEKLWLQLGNFADTLSKSATKQVIEALRIVIADFNHNLTEQFGDNFKQLNKAIANLLEWQKNYKSQLEEMRTQYSHGVESISESQSSLAQISEQVKSIPETMSGLKGVMEINQHQLGELERHLAVFKDMSEKATEAMPQMQKQVQATVNDISAAVTVASEHYNSLLNESDDYIKKHITTSNNLLDKFSTEAEKGLNNVSGLNKTIAEMINTLVDDAQQMTSTMRDANQNLVSDTELVRDTVIKSADKLQLKLAEVIDEVALQQVNQAKRTFDAMEDQIKQQGGIAGEVVDSQLKLIDSAMQKEINRVMSEMGLALAQVSGKFVEDYIKLTKAMDEIINQRVM